MPIVAQYSSPKKPRNSGYVHDSPVTVFYWLVAWFLAAGAKIGGL